MAIWKGLSVLGNLDHTGKQAFNSVFGEQVVGSRSDGVSVMFQYGNSTRDVKPFTSGTGVISNVGELCEVATGTGIGTATLTSVAAIRYTAGHEVVAQFSALFENAEPGVSQYVGVLNSVDGAAFGTRNGELGVWIIQRGVELFIPRTEWTGDRLDGSKTIDWDPNMLNIFMIQYGWLGAAPIVFSVYTGHARGWQVVHVHDTINTSPVPHLGNPSLPLAAKVTRAQGTGSNAKVRCASWRGGVVLGEEEFTANRWFSHTTLEMVVTPLTRQNVFTLRNETTFGGKTNHVSAELAIISFDNASNKTCAFYGVKNAELTGNSAYTSIDAGNSIISVSTGGTISTGSRGPATVIKAFGDRRTEVLGTGIIIYPGETFTVEVFPASSANGTVSVSCRWVEKF